MILKNKINNSIMNKKKGAELSDAMEVFELINIHKHFGNLHVLKGIDLKIKKGEIVSIIGGSGSGKSTILRCINQLEKISEGDILINGISMKNDRKKFKDHKKKLGMVFQNFNLFPHYTVLENVKKPQMVVKQISEQDADIKARNLLESVRLSDKIDVYPAQLSGGQKQRVAIARAMAMEPEIILFDEPTSSLDPELVGEVLEAIKMLAKEGMTMIIVTHELAFAKEISDTVVYLDGGKICEIGTVSQIFDNPQNDRTKSFISRLK